MTKAADWLAKKIINPNKQLESLWFNDEFEFKKFIDWLLLVWTFAWFSDIHITSTKEVFFRTNRWLQNVTSEYVANVINQKKDPELIELYLSFLKSTKGILKVQHIKLALWMVLWGINSKLILTNLVEWWSSNFSYRILSDKAEYWKFSYRIIATKNRDWLSLVIRTLPDKEFPFESTGLPKSLLEVSLKEKSWLVIITWPTGSWKTSSLISTLSVVNRTQNKHILTLEDPVEFDYPQGNCLVSQREIWSDSWSFEEAIMDWLRQDPDIIVIWELRSPEVIKLALEAATTWHLVFASFHAWSVVETIEWIIKRSWNEDSQLLLASTLKAVCTQVMIRYEWKDKKWKKKILVEYLKTSIWVEAIIKGKAEQMKSLNTELLKTWNIPLEESVFWAVRDLIISLDEAYDILRWKVKKENDFIEKYVTFLKNKWILKEEIKSINEKEAKSGRGEWSKFILKL